MVAGMPHSRRAPLAQLAERRPFKSIRCRFESGGAHRKRPIGHRRAAWLPCARMEVQGRTERRRAPRRRRAPEVAEREIIAAAESFLRERPFRELTVDEVMRRTDLSRPSFYVYFRDRHQLVLRVVGQIRSELFAMSERWYRGEGDGRQLAREAAQGIVAVFAVHGRVLRALSDAAADDPEVEAAYEALVESFVVATARHIEAEIAA